MWAFKLPFAVQVQLLQLIDWAHLHQALPPHLQTRPPSSAVGSLILFWAHVGLDHLAVQSVVSTFTLPWTPLEVFLTLRRLRTSPYPPCLPRFQDLSPPAKYKELYISYERSPSGIGVTACGIESRPGVLLASFTGLLCRVMIGCPSWQSQSLHLLFTERENEKVKLVIFFPKGEKQNQLWG